MTTRTYRILLQEEPEGGYTVTVPALPGCITYGKNLEHAMEMAKEAIEGYIELLEIENESVPDDSKTLEYSLTLAS
ncbi:MAG: type II toxin-antitoxin system HicB family antitoxin [Chitinophagales bacterium]